MNTKNRYLIGILVLSVAGLWGYICYSVWNSFFKIEEVQVVSAFTPGLQAGSTEPDTFSLLANYRDPFLSQQAPKKVTPVKQIVKVNPSPPKPTQPWPEVSYGGMIRNQKSNDQLALITVNGKSELVGPGGQWQELQVKKIYKDSIELSFGKETKIVRK